MRANDSPRSSVTQGRGPERRHARSGASARCFAAINAKIAYSLAVIESVGSFTGGPGRATAALKRL